MVKKIGRKLRVNESEAQGFVDAMLVDSDSSTISLSGFLEKNIEALSNLGEPVRYIHRKFVEHGLDVGTYPTFLSIYRAVEKTYLESKKSKGAGE